MRCISIHATHAGGDPRANLPSSAPSDFNPRHPCGWRLDVLAERQNKLEFQSTPPMRVATTNSARTATPVVFQSTPPMRVATSQSGSAGRVMGYFNPRHPCGWRHQRHSAYERFPDDFNPRHPCGWRHCPSSSLQSDRNFNPRHPCGWRQRHQHQQSQNQLFQSTPPMRVATST